jgi:integrase
VTVNRYLAALKAAFSLAAQNEKVEHYPVKRVKLARDDNKRTRYLTEEEEARLLAVLPVDYHALVKVALHTGMRKRGTVAPSGERRRLSAKTNYNSRKQGGGSTTCPNEWNCDSNVASSPANAS